MRDRWERLAQQRKASETIARLAQWLGVRFDRLLQLPYEKPNSVYFRCFRSSPLLHKFLFEIRNFLGRIEMSFGKSLWVGGLCIGQSSQGPKAESENDWLKFRMLCIQNLEVAVPWATIVDSQILLRVLDSGVRKNFHICTERNKQESASSFPESVHSIPKLSPSLLQPSQASPATSDARGKRCSARSVAPERL
jgi:hypothetical protein